MMVWVWPPQISISTQGRVQQAAISAARARAMRPSRYSSRYFMEALCSRLWTTVARGKHVIGDVDHMGW